VDDLNREVPMFDDESIGIESQERDAGEILSSAVDEPGPGATPDRSAIAVDDGCSELAVGQRFFVKDASEMAS
jgi:hypothetical protein